MVNEVDKKGNINSSSRNSFTQIDKVDPLTKDNKWVRRVLAFILEEHFEELTRAAFTSTTPFIKELDLVNSAIEYPFTFPINTKQFEVIPVGQNRITYSYNLGGTITDEAIQNDRHESFDGSGLNLGAALTLYVKADLNSTKVKIKYWT